MGPLYLDPIVISSNSFYFYAEKITARKIVYFDFHSFLPSLTQNHKINDLNWWKFAHLYAVDNDFFHYLTLFKLILVTMILL